MTPHLSNPAAAVRLVVALALPGVVDDNVAARISRCRASAGRCHIDTRCGDRSHEVAGHGQHLRKPGCIAHSYAQE
jgi:hypothetical protein